MNQEKNSHLREALDTQSKSCYPGTQVLINYFDIHDAKQLEQVEAAISAYKLSKMYKIDYPFDISIENYLSIHKYLFEMVYPFAGQIRTENIQKSNEPYIPNSVTPFCRPEFIYNNLKQIIDQMKVEFHTWKSEEEMIKRLAYFFGEMNMIHPFREGNGRTQREFFRQYIRTISPYLPFGNYELDYSCAKDDEMVRVCLIKGSIECNLTGNTRGIEIFLKRCLVSHQIDSKKI